MSTNSKRIGWLALIVGLVLIALSADGSLWQGLRVAQLRVRLSAVLIVGVATVFLWDATRRRGLVRAATAAEDPSPSAISVEELAPPVMLVVLRGNHDPSTTPQIRRALTARKPVIVDLSDASSIDDSVVGVLKTASTQTTLVVVSPTGTQPRLALEVVRAGNSVPLVNTQSAAREILGSRGIHAFKRR